MVLPILIGCGVTLFAVSTQSALRAWQVYKTLTPKVIAQLNGISWPESKYKFNNTSKYNNSRLNPSLKHQLEQYYGGFHHKMNETEALLILNISPKEINSLDERMLKVKYRNALIQNHPDKGGSPYLASKINEARELLSQSLLVRKD